MFEKSKKIDILKKELEKRKLKNMGVPNYFSGSINEIPKYFQYLNSPLILRSCVNHEDWKYSFSGVFESFYPIYTEVELKKYLSKMSIFWNIKLKEYEKLNELNNFHYYIYPILQEFIIWDFSFVIDTLFKDKYLRIEAVPWINENLTSWISRESVIINYDKLQKEFYIEKNINNNDYFLTILNWKKQSKFFLVPSFEINFFRYYVNKLINAWLLIEYIFSGKSQIIEWTIKNKKIWVLQSKDKTV